MIRRISTGRALLRFAAVDAATIAAASRNPLWGPATLAQVAPTSNANNRSQTRQINQVKQTDQPKRTIDNGVSDAASTVAWKLKTTKYVHYKGDPYYFLGTGIHTETNEELVFYFDRSNRLFARPTSMFFSKIEKGDEVGWRFTEVLADDLD